MSAIKSIVKIYSILTVIAFAIILTCIVLISVRIHNYMHCQNTVDTNTVVADLHYVSISNPEGNSSIASTWHYYYEAAGYSTLCVPMVSYNNKWNYEVCPTHNLTCVRNIPQNITRVLPEIMAFADFTSCRESIQCQLENGLLNNIILLIVLCAMFLSGILGIYTLMRQNHITWPMFLFLFGCRTEIEASEVQNYWNRSEHTRQNQHNVYRHNSHSSVSNDTLLL